MSSKVIIRILKLLTWCFIRKSLLKYKISVGWKWINMWWRRHKLCRFNRSKNFIFTVSIKNSSKVENLTITLQRPDLCNSEFKRTRPNEFESMTARKGKIKPQNYKSLQMTMDHFMWRLKKKNFWHAEKFYLVKITR